MSRLIQRTFKITDLDDEMLVQLAQESGTLSKSAELRGMIRAEFERRGLMLPQEDFPHMGKASPVPQET